MSLKGVSNGDESEVVDESTLEPIDKRKLFVGGLSLDTDEEDLKGHFEQFGRVLHCVVKREPQSGRSRCFGFITFLDSTAMKKVTEQSGHTVKGRRIDPKPAEPRSADDGIMKIFIGGLDSNMEEEDLRAYFAKNGTVKALEWPKDRMRGGQKKNFAFVEFEDEKVVNEIVRTPKQEIGGRMCDVRKAIPPAQKEMQNRNNDRNGGWNDNGGGGGYGGGFGGGGGGGFGGGYGGYGGMDPYAAAAAAAAYGYGFNDFSAYYGQGYDPSSFFGADPSSMAAYYDMSGGMGAYGGGGGYGGADAYGGGGGDAFRGGSRGGMRGGDSRDFKGGSMGNRGGSGTGRGGTGGYHPYKR